MSTLRDSSNFASNGNGFVSNGSNHPSVIGSVASNIASVFRDRSVGALHPTAVIICQPKLEVVLHIPRSIESITRDIGSVFGAFLE